MTTARNSAQEGPNQRSARTRESQTPTRSRQTNARSSSATRIWASQRSRNNCATQSHDLNAVSCLNSWFNSGNCETALAMAAAAERAVRTCNTDELDTNHHAYKSTAISPLHVSNQSFVLWIPPNEVLCVRSSIRSGERNLKELYAVENQTPGTFRSAGIIRRELYAENFPQRAGNSTAENNTQRWNSTREVIRSAG